MPSARRVVRRRVCCSLEGRAAKPLPTLLRSFPQGWRSREAKTSGFRHWESEDLAQSHLKAGTARGAWSRKEGSGPQKCGSADFTLR
jgi:hypothetical protein